MNLEVGKYYRTRDGRKAYVVGEDAVRFNFRVVEYLTKDNKVNEFAVVNQYGSKSAITDDDGDLVAAWKEELSFEWGPGLIGKHFKIGNVHFCINWFNTRSNKASITGNADDWVTADIAVQQGWELVE